jgi:hypothetical protein
MDALAGAVTNGRYLRGDGTDVIMDTLRAGDMTGTIAVANGGTGQTTLSSNHVLLGNGTSGVQAVAPGSSGNVLTSNGTTWSSVALPAGGVTSLNGETGAITNTSLYAIGSYVAGFNPANTGVAVSLNTTYAGSTIRVGGITSGNNITGVQTPSGTWRALGAIGPSLGDGTNSYFNCTLFVRIS